MASIGTGLSRAFIIAIVFWLCLVSPSPAAADYSWTSGGPYGGNTFSLAVSPGFASDHTLFAGTYGGVFKSTDGGSTWTGPGSGMDGASQVKSIAVSPDYAVDHTLFAGVLDSYSYDGYIMKSTDGGATWSTVMTLLSSTIYPAPLQATIYSIAFSPSYATDQTVFASSAGGVYRTTNGGGSWTGINNGMTGYKNVRSIAVSTNYSSDNTVYAASAESGVYKSTNRGTHWTATGALPNNSYARTVALSPGFTQDNTMFAGTDKGVCTSTDGGGTWSDISDGLTNILVNSLAVSPSYAVDHTIFAATVSGIFKRSGGSSVWTPLDIGPTNGFVYAVVVSPGYPSDGVAFSCKDDGVFKTSDGGGSWAASNGRMSNMPVYALGVSPAYSSDSTMFAGTWGAGVFRTYDGGATWAPVNTGLTDLYVFALAVSPGFSSDRTVFAGTEGGHIFKTTDGGTGWTEVTNGAATSNIRALVLSPGYVTDHTVFFCSWGDGIKKSTDGGATWASANTGMISVYAYSMGISPDFPTDHTVFAGDYYATFKSTNGGANWLQCNAGLSYTPVNALGVSSTYPADNTVFAGTEGGGVFKSTDGETSWNMTASGADWAYVYALAVAPDYSTKHIASAGTWPNGVYRTKDGGSSWLPLNSGLGNRNISALYDTGQTLVAGTETGVWSVDTQDLDFTPPVTTLTAPADGSVLTSSFIISGTTTDPETGVARVEVSVNNGPWLAPTDTSGNGSWSSWSYGFRPPATGSYALRARGTDNAGNVESPKPAVTVTVSALGVSELQHNNWNQVLSGGSCTFCHTAPVKFLPARFRQDGQEFCLSCHNQAGVAHEVTASGGKGHSTYTAISPVKCKLPTYGNVTAAQKNNQPFSRLMPVNIITCNTCHNVMSKTEDFSRVWEKTTTTDNRVYRLQNGGWAGMGYQKINVYRDTTLWASSPTYSTEKKKYLVSPSEYSYDENSGTVTFANPQASSVYVYVTLDYPYTRAGAQDNHLCSDCHTEHTHLGSNCLACHRAHNTENISGVRENIRAVDMTAMDVKFLRYTGANSFADGDSTHDGVCEVCHTRTKYYRRDGTGFAAHSGGVNYDRMACTTCHSHATGFAK